MVGCGMGAGLGLLWGGAGHRRALGCSPRVGGGGGGVGGWLGGGGGHVGDGPVAAALVGAAALALTGLPHVDGLIAAADGLLPPLDRDRRLAVMSTPDA